jgi:hypothetical protein
MYVVTGFLLALYIPPISRSASTATPTGYLAWACTPRARCTKRWARRSTLVLRFHLVVGRDAAIATPVLAA